MENAKDAKTDELCMSWDDSIELDAQENYLIEGTYIFTVTSVERGRFPGSAKLPPCNKATVSLEIVTEDGNKAFCRLDFILYRTLEWKLSAFFRSLGFKKPGERMSMDWSQVVGSQGRAVFKPTTYKSKYGNERTINSVERFLDYDKDLMPVKDVLFSELPENYPLPF